ncbi:MAG: glycosyl transferase, partial [Chloroflexi bacterium]|nr:glycosyl transferase [Chloroflexota bacterium]
GYSTLYGSSAGIPSAGPQVAGSFGNFGGAPGGAAPDRTDGQFDHTRGDATTSANIPSVDTTASSGGMPGGGPGGDVSSELISYLEANQGSDTYLIATTDSQSAAQIILASDQPVMSLGGFTGSDPILTVDQFASLVESGQVRYVLAGGGMGGGPQGSGTSAIISWAKANGTLVTIGQSQVYDLGSLQGASA